MLGLFYYPGGSRGPVGDYLADLARERPKAYAQLRFDLDVLGVEGLWSRRASVRSMGRGLWELRRLNEGIQYRLFFCVHDGAIWLLHHLEKKSAQTPRNDLELARKRLKEVMAS